MISTVLKTYRVPFNYTDNYIVPLTYLDRMIPKHSFKVQYQQPSQQLELTVAIEKDEDYQLLETVNYVSYAIYSSIYHPVEKTTETTHVSTAYYYLVDYERVSAKVVKLTLVMDILNTYDNILRNHIIDQTFVIREHTPLTSPLFAINNKDGKTIDTCVNDVLENTDIIMSYDNTIKLPLEQSLIIRYNDDVPYSAIRKGGSQRVVSLPYFENGINVYPKYHVYKGIKYIDVREYYPKTGLLLFSFAQWVDKSYKNIMVNSDFQTVLLLNQQEQEFIYSGDARTIALDLGTGDLYICYNNMAHNRYSGLSVKYVKSVKNLQYLRMLDEKIRKFTYLYIPYTDYHYDIDASRIFFPETINIYDYATAYSEGFIYISKDTYPITSPYVKRVSKVPIPSNYSIGYVSVKDSGYYHNILLDPDGEMRVIVYNLDEFDKPINNSVTEYTQKYSSSIFSQLKSYKDLKKEAFNPNNDNLHYSKIKNLKEYSPQFFNYEIKYLDWSIDVNLYDVLGNEYTKFSNVLVDISLATNTTFLSSLFVAFDKTYTFNHPQLTTDGGTMIVTNFIEDAVSNDTAETQRAMGYNVYQNTIALRQEKLSNKEAMLDENNKLAGNLSATDRWANAGNLVYGLGKNVLGGAVAGGMFGLPMAIAGAGLGTVHTINGAIRNNFDIHNKIRHREATYDLQKEAIGMDKNLLMNEYKSHMINNSMSNTTVVVGESSLLSEYIGSKTSSNFFINTKSVTSIEQERLRSIFHYTGYACNRMKIPEFHSMHRFNYVQADLTLTESEAPLWAESEYIERFKDGVTIFHDVPDIDLYRQKYNRPLKQKG